MQIQVYHGELINTISGSLKGLTNCHRIILQLTFQRRDYQHQQERVVYITEI